MKSSKRPYHTSGTPSNSRVPSWFRGSISSPTRKLDPDTGQVYLETILKEENASIWRDHVRGCIDNLKRSKKTSPGADSLARMAMRSVLTNSASLTVESLNGLPWSFAMRIYELLDRS